MAATREQILAQLEKQFPDRVIYPETYTPQMVGAFYQIGIRKLAKQQKMTQAQWLQENGFIWRETGYVEPDMLRVEVTFKRDSPLAVADSVMRRYPLIGEYEPSETESAEFFSMAQKTVQKLCAENTSLNRAEELVLTISTVQLVKNWSSEIRGENGLSFWQFVFLQFGFNPENSPAVAQRVYAGFRHAIKNTLKHYRRYLAPDHTMRYYTSLLLHALAPVQSIENLFDILFDFYVKNLDFQYQPEDPVFRTLVHGIQARWKDVDRSTDSLQLRSSEVMSGLKTLFLERPGFMAHTCETLVQKIDLMLRGEVPKSEDRWDLLIKDWFEKKSRIERTRLQGQKRTHKTEFVATSADRIYLQYAVENGQVGLVIPRIRLTEVGTTRPILTLYQGTKEIWREILSVTGNDLSLTTVRRFVALPGTKLDWTQPLELCGEIEYHGEILFTSGSRLFRAYILFDANGNERTIRSGMAYLLTDECRSIEFADYDAVLQKNHPGQLFQIDLSQVGAVTVDGEELFADEVRVGSVRIYPTISPIKGVAAVKEGKRYEIYDRPFQLLLHLPDDANPLRYQLLLDGKPLHSEMNQCGSLKRFAEAMSAMSEVHHTVRVIDLVQNTIIKELNFVILPVFSYQLDKPYYLETEERASALVSFGHVQENLELVRISESDTARAVSYFDKTDYEIDLPTIHCSFGNKSAFLLPEHLWKGDVDKAVLSSLSIPPGWSASLMLGIQSLSASGNGVFEIGNMVHADDSDRAELPFWLYLISPQGERRKLLLTVIILQPTFLSSPFEVRQNNALFWVPEGRFFGKPSSCFRVVLRGKDQRSFELGLAEQILCSEGALKHGYYHYEVFLKTGGLFSRSTESTVLDGEVVIGDENEFRFCGKELHLFAALFWSFKSDRLEIQSIRPGTAILTKLRYLGNSIPSGESIELPGYEAVLSFERKDGERVLFNFSEDSKEYEWINPVRVWIVNERRLVLRTVTEDAMYFDTANVCLMNRRPEHIMTKAAQKLRLQTPDYYDYDIRGERDV